MKKISSVFVLLVVFAALFSISCLKGEGKQTVNESTESPKKMSEQSVSQPAVSGAKLYTSCNLWFEKPDQMYCINYKKGGIIPAGTEVTNVSIGKGAIGMREAIYFTASNGQNYRILFQPKFHPGISINEFKNKIFISQTFNELTKGLKESEIDAIKQGIVKSGMSKKAVLVSYGYPPEHKTFNTDNNVWTYWIDRYRMQTVQFDSNGLSK